MNTSGHSVWVYRSGTAGEGRECDAASGGVRLASDGVYLRNGAGDRRVVWAGSHMARYAGREQRRAETWTPWQRRCEWWQAGRLGWQGSGGDADCAVGDFAGGRGAVCADAGKSWPRGAWVSRRSSAAVSGESAADCACGWAEVGDVSAA